MPTTRFRTGVCCTRSWISDRKSSGFFPTWLTNTIAQARNIAARTKGTGEPIAWATVVAGASRRGETALGWKSDSLAEDGTEFGVRVNPGKSEILTPRPGDRIVVLAND